MKTKIWAVASMIAGAVYFFLPLAAVFLFSLHGTKGTLGFSAYLRVFADPEFAKSFLFSFQLSLAVIMIGFALVIPAAIHVRLKRPKLRPVVETITNLPFTIPVIVLAYGLIRIYSAPPVSLTSTPFLLAVGCTVICLPYIFRTIDAGLGAIDLKTLTEAAASLGASQWRTLAAVIIPNIRTAMLGAASIVFAMVMGELTLAVMLAWPAFGPYMALVGRDLAYEPAALAVVSFSLTWISVALFHVLSKTDKGLPA